MTCQFGVGDGGRAGKERQDTPTADPFGISISLLLLQDVALSLFLDDRKVIHAQGRDPIPSLSDSATVRKPIPVNTDLAAETGPPYGKSK